MQLAKYSLKSDPRPSVGLLEAGRIRPLSAGQTALTHILESDDVAAHVRELASSTNASIPVEDIVLLPPIDDQEVWGAGVTYERSKVARQEESESEGTFYDKVYRAPRPELFFKATPSRVVGPGGAIRVRRDTRWCVPEPELALVISSKGKLVGFTVGNDVSARDIEGENPLYLPQAKVYDACCGLGPVVALAEFMPPLKEVEITLRIERGGNPIVEGQTSLSRMARRLEDLIEWLWIDNLFPNGVILLTGTGIVPPDEFSLQPDDRVSINISGIGSLTNSVVQSARP